MSDDTPLPRRNSDGTTTVTTLDAGDIRLVCPPWCAIQHGYRHPPAKADISHSGEPVWALADTPEYGQVSMVLVYLSQWPYRRASQVFLSVQTDEGYLEVNPTGAQRIAAALRQHADHIDAMAGQLEAIRAGEDR